MEASSFKYQELTGLIKKHHIIVRDENKQFSKWIQSNGQDLKEIDVQHRKCRLHTSYTATLINICVNGWIFFHSADSEKMKTSSDLICQPQRKHLYLCDGGKAETFISGQAQGSTRDGSWELMESGGNPVLLDPCAPSALGRKLSMPLTPPEI